MATDRRGAPAANKTWFVGAVSFARLKTSFVPFGMLFNKIEIDNDQDNNYWYRPDAKR